MDFENKLDNEGIYYSRWIASWVNEGGTFDRHGKSMFKDWIHVLIDDEKIEKEIFNLATNGKLELETSARLYLKNHNAI